MKVGDKVKIRNYTQDSCETYIVLEILEESVKVKHPTISGYFIFSKDKVVRM